MIRAGRDARRRNRNIGTAKSGHGQNNKLTIPESWAIDRRFTDKLIDPVAIVRGIKGSEITFLIEPTQSGFFHASTPQDIERVLSLLPVGHVEEIKMIVLRQPKKKERILSPVWGRLCYLSEILWYSGPAIHLDANPVNYSYKKSKSMTPEEKREFDGLAADGHTIKTNKRHYTILTSMESVRRTQLYRTLPHEVGHYVDYLQSVKRPAGDDIDEWFRLNELDESKPKIEKEDFAHRYATEFYSEQARTGNLPFDRLYDPEQLKAYKLEPIWFGGNSNEM
jgi:hypothetical protein